MPAGAPMDDPLVAPAGVTASQFTLRWFDGLPDFIKAADQATGWQLLRFLSLVGDQADELEVLYERFDFTPLDEGGEVGDTSDLIDPDTADADWLPWIAQLVGVRLPAAATEAERRAAIASAAIGWQAGSKASIAAAARTALTGSQYVGVYNHSDASGIGAGGQWDVLLVTRPDETASGAAVLAAVESLGATPAGVVLYHMSYAATWAQIEAAYPTWADRDGLTWTVLTQTGI